MADNKLTRGQKAEASRMTNAANNYKAAKKAAISKMRKTGGKYDSVTPGYGFDGMQGQPKNPKLQGD